MQDKKSKYSITPGEYAANVCKEDGYSEISEAIEYGDIDAVKRFIKEGADIHTLGVFYLAKSHNGKMLQFLIEQGADIFQEEEGSGDSIMSYVVDYYRWDVRRYKEGDKPNNSGDRFSSEQDIHNKYLGIIKVLAGHGYDVNKPILSHFTPLQLHYRFHHVSLCVNRRFRGRFDTAAGKDLSRTLVCIFNQRILHCTVKIPRHVAQSFEPYDTLLRVNVHVDLIGRNL